MLKQARRKFGFLLLTAVTVVFIAFAVVNRQFMHLSLFPLPYTADMPVFVFALLCFTGGALVGWGFACGGLLKSHRLAKSEHKHVMALQNEMERLQSEQHHHPIESQDQLLTHKDISRLSVS